MLEWFKKRLSEFSDVAPVNDLDMSWKNGLAFSALIQVYRPTLMLVAAV
jgi:CAMSAP CH domain